MRIVLVLMLVALTGCAGHLADLAGASATRATNDSFTAADSPENKAKEDDAAKSAGGAAAQGFTTVLLSPDVEARLKTMEVTLGSTLGGTLRVQLSKAMAEAKSQLDELVSELKALLAGLPALVDELRERLVGVPLQKDVDALSPHLAAAVTNAGTAARVQADVEIGKLQKAVTWLGVGVVVLLGAVIVIGVLHTKLKREVRSSRRVRA